MTDQGETVTQKGESAQNDPQIDKAELCYCRFQLEHDLDTVSEKREDEKGVDGEEITFELATQGMHVWYTNRRVVYPQSTIIEYKEPVVQLYFAVRGRTEYRAPDQAKPFIRIEAHQHNLLLVPASTFALDWAARAPHELFVITLAPALFFKYLPHHHAVSQQFRCGLEDQVPLSLSKNGLPLTARIGTILYDLLHCELSGCYKGLFVEAKIVELLALQLEQYEQVSQRPHPGHLKREDVEKMHLVRDLMLASPGKTYSLKDLAHEVGTNEYNLKNHFKRVFGTTVFGYLQEYRMEQSKRILSRGEEKISEVARLMGYKHATHFTAAFKKYFGFLPHKIRVGE